MASALKGSCRLLGIGAGVALMASDAPAQQAVLLVRGDRLTVPVVASMPGSSPCRGLAILSPGAGGSEQGYRYLARALRSLGYLTVVVGHQDSGRRALRDRVRAEGLRAGLTTLSTDPTAYRSRLLDIATARAWAASRCAGTESVLIGHSMGAATAMIEAGARNRLGLKGANAFGTYIALSPQGEGALFPGDAWNRIGRPVLIITGTRDRGLDGSPWQSRTEPYRAMPSGCRWLAILPGASHLNLAGFGLTAAREARISELIGAFLAGVRQGDCRARPIPGVVLRVR